MEPSSCLADQARRLPGWLAVDVAALSAPDVYLLKLLAALRQWHIIDAAGLTAPSDSASEPQTPSEALASALSVVRNCERFYDVIGGAVGYQLTALRLIDQAEHGHTAASESSVTLLDPRGLHLVEQPEEGLRAAAAGLAALPSLGELYPLGGAGDRLGLVDDATGEALPVAMLPYCGRSLLEGLLRDLAAREFLHYRVHGAQLRTPVAVMTSEAKGNHARVLDLFQSADWFGRGVDGVCIIKQPMVPVLGARSGSWLLCSPGSLLLKPGGHGAIWKLAADAGVLDWLAQRGAEAVLVRQISNPMAAMDTTLLALAGEGQRRGASFGFVSCCRAPGAAEGVNVLLERRSSDGLWQYNVSNLEYTEFARLGVNEPDAYPANTNILYVALAAARAALATPDGALPGLLVNLSKAQVAFGEPLPVRGGRLECSMQSLADAMAQSFDTQLPKARWAELTTFCIQTLRRRATSSAKRRLELGGSQPLRLSQTPEGSFLDLLRNGRDMLLSGGSQLPELADEVHSLRTAPPFLLRWHPALGPLWHVAAQKVRCCTLRSGSELELEVAELDAAGLVLDGSLMLTALQPLGGPAGAYSATACGRARLCRVAVHNRGVDWAAADNVYWAAKVARHEAMAVIIHGCAACATASTCPTDAPPSDGEFDAEDVTLLGNHRFEVPAGMRCSLRPVPGGAEGEFQQELTALQGGPSWQWHHAQQPDGSITLTRL